PPRDWVMNTVAIVRPTPSPSPSWDNARCLRSANPISIASPPAQIVSATSFGSWSRSEEHTSELQSRFDLVCRLLLEKKKTYKIAIKDFMPSKCDKLSQSNYTALQKKYSEFVSNIIPDYRWATVGAAPITYITLAMEK